MTEKNLIRVYTGATSEKRIDIIIKNYTKFIGIVDGYTDGLRYMIECEKESSHRQSAGDLGVRVQTGGMTSDPTARKAINNVITRERSKLSWRPVGYHCMWGSFRCFCASV